MAKVFIPVVFGSSILSALTRYFACANGDQSTTTPEAEVQVKFNVTGTFSNLQCTVSANNLNGASTVRVRKNAANGNEVVSIGSSATGFFEDTSNTDTVSANDLINFSLVSGGSSGSITVFAIATIFNATSDNFNRFAGGMNGFSSASTTGYYPLAGSGTLTGTEANVNVTVRNSFTGKNLSVYINSNSRTTTSVFRTRKNAANGALSVSVGASATGLFEDNTNTDSLVTGDTYNLALTTGSGTGTIQPRITSVAVTNTSVGWSNLGGHGCLDRMGL